MSIKLYELVGSDPSRPFSPHCWKSRMTIVHKGLPCETVPVRFTEISDIEHGGFSRVPVINHGGNLVHDSFDIAVYLSEAYPDTEGRLFKGAGTRSLSRFVEAWAQTQIHPWVAKWALMDIHNMLDEKDQAYFRESREKLFGKKLEDVVDQGDEHLGQLKSILMPLRLMLKTQPFIGGEEPLFADYIAFGAFQWLRVCSGLHMIEQSDPAMDWINRMLDLHDGLARSVSEANA